MRLRGGGVVFRDRVVGEQVGRVKQGEHFRGTLKPSNVISGGCKGERRTYKLCPFDKMDGTENLSAVILSLLFLGNKPRNAPCRPAWFLSHTQSADL